MRGSGRLARGGCVFLVLLWFGGLRDGTLFSVHIGLGVSGNESAHTKTTSKVLAETAVEDSCLNVQCMALQRVLRSAVNYRDNALESQFVAGCCQ